MFIDFNLNRRMQPMEGRKMNLTAMFKKHTEAQHEAHEAKEGAIEPVTDTE